MEIWTFLGSLYDPIKIWFVYGPMNSCVKPLKPR
jgi:hypothetical protein